MWEYAPESQSLNEVASTTLQNTKHLDIIMSCLAGNLLIYFNTRLNTVNVWDFKEDLHAIFAAPENTSRGLSDVSIYLNFTAQLTKPGAADNVQQRKNNSSWI